MSNCNEVEAQANNYENKGSLSTYFKNSFAWWTGMKELIFDYSNFFRSGHFSIQQIWKNGSKKDWSQNVKGLKNYSFHASEALLSGLVVWKFLKRKSVKDFDKDHFLLYNFFLPRPFLEKTYLGPWMVLGWFLDGSWGLLWMKIQEPCLNTKTSPQRHPRG